MPSSRGSRRGASRDLLDLLRRRPAGRRVRRRGRRVPAREAGGRHHVAGPARPSRREAGPAPTGPRRPLTAADAFVAALDAGGGTLAYGTYLGGSGDDRAFDSGSTPAGTSTSPARPIPSATRNAAAGRSPRSERVPAHPDLTVTRSSQDRRRRRHVRVLHPARRLAGEGGLGVAADAGDRAQVVGYTLSPDFPGATGPGRAGVQDGFIVKIAPRGAGDGASGRRPPTSTPTSSVRRGSAAGGLRSSPSCSATAARPRRPRAAVDSRHPRGRDVPTDGAIVRPPGGPAVFPPSGAAASA